MWEFGDAAHVGGVATEVHLEHDVIDAAQVQAPAPPAAVDRGIARSARGGAAGGGSCGAGRGGRSQAAVAEAGGTCGSRRVGCVGAARLRHAHHLEDEQLKNDKHHETLVTFLVTDLVHSNLAALL